MPRFVKLVSERAPSIKSLSSYLSSLQNKASAATATTSEGPYGPSGKRSVEEERVRRKGKFMPLNEQGGSDVWSRGAQAELRGIESERIELVERDQLQGRWGGASMV